MQLFVKHPSGPTMALDVEASATVYNLKCLIRDRQGLTPSRQSLKTMGGRALRDEHTLSTCGVRAHTTLQLVIPPCSRNNAPLVDTTELARRAARGTLRGAVRLPVDEVGLCDAGRKWQGYCDRRFSFRLPNSWERRC
eukprot:TRINITY_DN63332_c0_g1_i1.p2 TRINITY_DN63332_c0_g1~~TRINITY_DN63332_c0_g1_i1.p2  ORF type:complete len:138 (+),score=19.61 TRINITY_DN63332_c0_g1_i1:136-549(+)